jgi:hypothetical protein
MSNTTNNHNNPNYKNGFVLLITLILLVVMATLGYTLSSRVNARRIRNQYIIDSSKARYGCDSGVKYMLANLENIEPQLISRPNEPDFSDLYALNDIGYQQLLQKWGIDANSSFTIRGPYGADWPLINEPVEFTIDSARVRIEITDENAKYPIGWVMLNDKEKDREIQAGYQTFCEMMQLDSEEIQSLKEQLLRIGQIRPFKVEFRPITQTENTPVTRSSGSTPVRSTTVKRTVVTVSTQIVEQTAQFAKLFHSSMLDIEPLSRPIIKTANRQESPLKYMGIWASNQININTAPRPVLEAAFIFGGNEVKIADEIIQKRRQKPFESISDLKTQLARYSDSIEKSEGFITTSSTLFTIKVKSTSGVATATSVVAIIKTGREIKKIAIINN